MASGDQRIRGSLWLKPSGPALDRLQEVIRTLTARFGGPWPTPHVSLLSRIELSAEGAEARLTQLASRIPPITIRLGRLEGRNEPFRCFYAVVEPSAELIEAHRVAHEVFERSAADPYEPHLSLLYGQIDAPTKERLARELRGRLPLSFIATTLHLVNASAAVPVARWHTLHEVALRRQRQRTVPRLHQRLGQ